MQMGDACLGCGWKGAYSSRGGGKNVASDGRVDDDMMDDDRAQDDRSYDTSVGKEHVFSLRASVPAYTAILDDGSRVELEDKEHVLSVNIANGYLVQHLIDDLASKTIWGTCQEPICWFWDRENKYLQQIITNIDLENAFNMYWSSKVVTLVVQFEVKPGYERSISMEEKLLGKLSCMKDASQSEGDVDPAMMYDADIFVGDDQFYAALGFRDEDDTRDTPKVEQVSDAEIHEAQILVSDNADCETNIVVDKENPKIKVGEYFPTMHDFRMALRQHAIKNEFEVHKVVTNKTRYRAECKAEGCNWRIVARKLPRQPTVKISMIPCEHDCVSSGKLISSMASQKWIAVKAVAWLSKNKKLGAKDVQNKLSEVYGVEVSYATAWAGTQKALDKIYGSLDDGFQSLFSFRAELLANSPRSIMEIDTVRFGDDVQFDKLFVALQPCIDGFKNGCRPYLGIDSTTLTGRYTGQLVAACALDGHNWMYPVAWGIIGSESKDNWIWFMRQLKKAIGHPPALAISSDECKGLDAAVKKVFPGVEHRECMRHLWKNFRKYFRGEIFDKNMWPAARAYTRERFNFHFGQIADACPDVVSFLNEHHNHLWSRSMFSTETKCDYVNNNLAECFNSWIKNIKDLPIVELIDRLRQMTMELWEKRRKIADKLSGNILPIIRSELKAKTRGLGHMSVCKNRHKAEVFGNYKDLTPWRHVVDLHEHTCSCRAWQVTGKPCRHALAFIQTERNVDLDSFVHEYYSVEMFKVAYSGTIPTMTDKSQWPNVNLGFKLLPPKLKMGPGRKRKNRFKASDEPGATKLNKCETCGEIGQHDLGCSVPKKRKVASKPKNRAVKPMTVPAVNISPGSIIRRRISLLQGGQEDAQPSTVANPVKRLLVLSQERGAASSIGTK